jgi:hypothetical protein
MNTLIIVLRWIHILSSVSIAHNLRKLAIQSVPESTRLIPFEFEVEI